MKCLVHLVYVLNMRGARDIFQVQKAFFLENNFWCADQVQLKTDKGYLYKVNIDTERKSGFTASFDCFAKTCYPLKSTNLGYVLLRYSVIEKYIVSFLKSPEVDKFLLRFHFFFTDEPTTILRYEGNIRGYVTYKFPEKVSESSIRLRCEGIDIRMKHIKERFKGLVVISLRLLKFNEFMKFFDGMEINSIKIESDENYNLYYFKNCSECLENLKKFIKGLCYLKLINDDFSSCNEFYVDMTTALEVSQFKNLLWERINEDLNYFEVDETWKLLFDECFNYLKDEMINNNLFLPIGGKYVIDFYIEQLSNLINESIEKILREYVVSIPENKKFISYTIEFLLKFGIKKLLLRIVQDLCESEYVPKHFLRKEITTLDDYKNVEKIVCDYYNMFVYIIKLYHRFIKEDPCVPYSYYPPIFIDNFNLRIIDGIKINFNWPAEFEQIKGFDEKGEEISMEKDTDFFIDIFDTVCCPSEVLKMKKIYEIEIISSDDEKNKKKFKVSEFLSI